MRWWVRGLSCKPDIYKSWSAFGFGVGLARLNWFGPSGGVFY